MALDVYVMPLGRFFAGDFISPLEKQFGRKPTVIFTTDYIHPPPPAPWPLRLLAKAGLVKIPSPGAPPQLTPDELRIIASHAVELLKTQVAAQAGVPVQWQDQGADFYGEQFGRPGIVRAFAAWHDHRDRMPDFPSVSVRDYHNHPVWKLPEPARRRFPTLASHSLHSGCFVPAPFEGVYLTGPFNQIRHWRGYLDVASTQTVLGELRDLLAFLGTLTEPGPGSSPLGNIRQQTANEEGDSFTVVRHYVEKLQMVCQLSLDHGLPVIFHG